MEETSVIIVGGGPTGVVLALLLAKQEISSIILEKDLDIEQDPRAAVISGDSVRIIWGLGIGDQMSSIGDPFNVVTFHVSNYQNPPTISVPRTADSTNQVVPDGIRHIQPRLEQALRDQVRINNRFCELRSGCEVVARQEVENGVIVEYKTPMGETRKIRAAWLVGADGKRGIVRKHFLEKQAGVRQEPGLYNYTGTWVAANLKMTLPTPESHPAFPLWKSGMSPEEVYDLFWPDGWHFCCPPGRATACGGLGPRKERWWRHEFNVTEWEDTTMDTEQLLWEHLTPMITITHDVEGKPCPNGMPVTFPKDCIEIKRCRPYTFAAKVVNKWFENRTILIGDAAHIFPPFAGQGMASGIRDAQGLAWRLALFIRAPVLEKKSTDHFLNQFSRERRQGIDDATKMTMLNAALIHENEGGTFDSSLPPLGDVAWEIKGYKGVEDGFFLPDRGGGGRVAQIYIRSLSGPPLLSDALFHHAAIAMTLLAIGDEPNVTHKHLVDTVRAARLPEQLLSERSIVYLGRSLDGWKAVGEKIDGAGPNMYYPCSPDCVPTELCPEGYDPSSFLSRLCTGTKYALVRPDWIIFSVATDLDELKMCLKRLGQKTEY